MKLMLLTFYETIILTNEMHDCAWFVRNPRALIVHLNKNGHSSFSAHPGSLHVGERESLAVGEKQGSKVSQSYLKLL